MAPQASEAAAIPPGRWRARWLCLGGVVLGLALAWTAVTLIRIARQQVRIAQLRSESLELRPVLERERELARRALLLQEELLAAGYQDLPEMPRVVGGIPWRCGTVNFGTEWWLDVPGQLWLRSGRRSIAWLQQDIAWAHEAEQGLPALERHVDSLLDLKRVPLVRGNAP